MNLSSDQDIIIENQRGFILMGLTFFSGKFLIPRIDPSHFQIFAKKKLIPIKNETNFNNLIEIIYPISFNEQENYLKSSRWVIELSKNKDEQGWQYSWHFNSRYWKPHTGIVRRRIWVKRNF